MATFTITTKGLDGAQVVLGRVSDAAATFGGSRLIIASNLPYAGPVETGRRKRRSWRKAGPAHMFRRGANEGMRGFDAELATALPGGPQAVTRAFLSRGRHVVDVVRHHTPVRSGRLRTSVTMRLERGR